MKFTVIKDMTTGKPGKILFKFCLPMLASVAFQQFYGLVDTITVGKFMSTDPVISENAVSAIGVSMPITLVFMAIATGANIGCSALISQLFGAKQYKKMVSAVRTSIITVIALSLILTVSGLILCQPALRWLDTPSEIMPDSTAYLNIYISSLFFLFLYNICTGIFNALGDSYTPLVLLVSSSVVNIALDLIFVIVFRMGVPGVAWATLAAQAVAGVLAFILVCRRMKKFSQGEKVKSFSGYMLKKVSLFAIPGIIQQLFVAVGSLIIQLLINGYGPKVIAGFSAALKLNTFAITCYMTVSGSISSFTAQNIGAKRYDRVTQGFKAGVLILYGLIAPIFILFFFFAPNMLQIMLSEASEVAIESGCMFMRWIAPFYFVIAIKVVIDGILRGAGALSYFMFSTVIDLILRVVLCFALNPWLDMMSLPVAWDIGWTVAAIFAIIFYKKNVWKKKLTV